MSVYASLLGTVTVDAAALERLNATTSWQWLGEPDAALVNGITITELKSGGLRLDFDGTSVRNLVRYLDVDLADAATAGVVTGTLTADCQDGMHQRTVVSYSPGLVLAGVTECLHDPVQAVPARVQTLSSLRDIHLRFLAPVDQDSAPVSLQGAPPVSVCACAGYDDDNEPRCVRER